MSVIQSASRSRLGGDLGLFGSDARRRKGIGRHHLVTAVTCIAALEFTLVACSAYLASFIYNEILLGRSPPTLQYVPAALFIATAIVVTSIGFRQYAAIPSITQRRLIWGGIGAVGLTFTFFLAAMFVLKVTNIYSRGAFLAQFITVALTLAAFRAAALYWVRSAIANGYLQASHLVVIGDPRNYEPTLSALAEQGIKVASSFDFPVMQSGTDVEHDQLSIDLVRDIMKECRSILPDDILIVPPYNDLNKAAELAVLLSELPASIHFFPQVSTNFLHTIHVGELGAQPTLQAVSRPLATFDRVNKRAFDIIASAFGLLVFSPILLLASIAIKLDSPGPVFFRQARHGFNNEPIQVLKFRSMRVTGDGNAFRQATKADPRITPVGRILRRTNIDELPQLFNVLLGEMSIVGPRPHPLALNEQYVRILPLMRRHRIKPGITGWAQVSGLRGETDTVEKMQQRLEFDLYYIDNWSFFFDIQIILLTLFSAKSYTNAY